MTFAQNLSNSEHEAPQDHAKLIAIERLLNKCNVGPYRLEQIPNDASHRIYHRVYSSKSSGILMDSSKEKSSLASFMKIAKLLHKNHIHAPEILGEDVEMGLLYLEDLGSASLTKHLTQHPEQEREIYLIATELLKHTADIDVDIDLPVIGLEFHMVELEVFLLWYLEKHRDLPRLKAFSERFTKFFIELFKSIESFKKSLVLRDYHADNLLWLPHLSGIARLGVVDFQDAILGPTLYDLISILEDARRDVAPATVEACKQSMFQYYAQFSTQSLEDCYTILAMKRNLRIIGVFHRLWLRDGKEHYRGYLPRVWNYIKAGLEKPIMAPLKELFSKYEIL